MVNKEDGGRSRKNEFESSKPRVQRASADGQRAFQERKERADQPFDASRPRERSGKRPERPKQEDNVNLFLSPRMLELAEELAQAEKMNLRQYLTEALKYILLAHGKRLGATEKYVTEFVSQNDKKIATWRSDTPATTDGAEEANEPDDGRPSYVLGPPVESRCSSLPIKKEIHVSARSTAVTAEMIADRVQLAIVDHVQLAIADRVQLAIVDRVQLAETAGGSLYGRRPEGGTGRSYNRSEGGSSEGSGYRARPAGGGESRYGRTAEGGGSSYGRKPSEGGSSGRT